MSNTAIIWGGGSTTFADFTDADTGTDNVKPISPYVIDQVSKWLISDNGDLPITYLFTVIG